MTSVLAFTLGPVLCAQAPTMLLLILFRVLQELGGGMLLPLGMMILTREAGPKRLGRLMAVLAVPGRAHGSAHRGWLAHCSCEWKSNLAHGVIRAWCGPGGVHVRPGGIFCPRTARSSPQRLQPTAHAFSKPAPAPEIGSIC
jgi:hypothetical protein